jgi:hypothetical protein
LRECIDVIESKPVVVRRGGERPRPFVRIIRRIRLHHLPLIVVIAEEENGLYASLDLCKLEILTYRRNGRENCRQLLENGDRRVDPLIDIPHALQFVAGGKYHVYFVKVCRYRVQDVLNTCIAR